MPEEDAAGHELLETGQHEDGPEQNAFAHKNGKLWHLPFYWEETAQRMRPSSPFLLQMQTAALRMIPVTLVLQ